MKQGIHPEYKELEVVRTDGSTFKTKSTYSKSNKIVLDIDSLNHQAWTGGTGALKETGRLAKFNSRYAALSGGAKKKDQAEKDDKKSDKES